MKALRDSVWQRCGTSWIWDAQALSQVTKVNELNNQTEVFIFALK